MEWFSTYSQGLKYNITISPSYCFYLFKLAYLAFNIVVFQLLLLAFELGANQWLIIMVTLVGCVWYFYKFRQDYPRPIVLFEDGVLRLDSNESQPATLTPASRTTPFGCVLAYQIEKSEKRNLLNNDMSLQVKNNEHWVINKQIFIFRDSVDAASYARLCRVIRRQRALKDI
ncbi:protein YgfX [Thalassotalea ganghwensis]